MTDTLKNTTNSSVYKKLKIRKMIKESKACLICIRRWKGRVRKYKTNC